MKELRNLLNYSIASRARRLLERHHFSKLISLIPRRVSSSAKRLDLHNCEDTAPHRSSDVGICIQICDQTAVNRANGGGVSRTPAITVILKTELMVVPAPAHRRHPAFVLADVRRQF